MVNEMITSIPLSPPMPLEDLEEMLEHVSEKMPANVYYKVSKHHNYLHEIPGQVRSERGTVNVYASFATIEGVIDAIESVPDRDTSRTAALRFLMHSDPEECPANVPAFRKRFTDVVRDYQIKRYNLAQLSLPITF